jgi:hypothetical protein
VEAQQEEDERLHRRYQQAPPPRAARFLLEGSKRRPRHERFVAEVEAKLVRVFVSQAHKLV